jgi:hypothetical protein
VPKDEDLFALPPAERLKRYRKRAEVARRAAAAVNSADLRKSYLTIAAYWEDLALLLEKAIRLNAQGFGASRPGRTKE